MRKSSVLRILDYATLVLSLATFTSAAFAQDRPTPASDKWRPKAGVYAESGRNFQSSCDESGGLTIDLGEKSVSGYEWGCDVKKITDLGPGSLKVEMVCDDYNLAQNINPRDPNWENRQFNEVMLVKRLDAATISVQKSLNGKLKDPPWRAAYCPLKTQRALAEATLRAKVEAKQKAEQDRTLKEAHPRDGVYAAAGPDFEDRCTKFSDTVVAFAGKSITTASNICKIENTRVQLPDTVRIGATCALQGASGPDAVTVQDKASTPDRENLMFKKIDDKTVILWIINNGHFTGDGRKLSYCSDQTQRAHAGQRRANKPTTN
ncbi:hypothetical protein [Bradyrhizobium cajani]|uniref:DUF3617 family protein n=1 Tax=Bradyrhizobium cajani TaxID=1928661 RepID=A0A844T994_9BRAD|nr:hypothetical protein [Bradyrhizobium cajani]MCP3367836.1 hypothetical protein [Bradyrhizobium cajani]MVT71671.1 hypothetical protein [Bradyrhizobium cajani]